MTAFASSFDNPFRALCRLPLAPLLFLAAVLFAHSACAQRDLAPYTIVIFNNRFPESPEIARFYAEKRGVPESNLIGLDCPQTEEISRQEFDSLIAGPLRKELVRRGLWKEEGKRIAGSRVRYAVLIRGMPLKIRSIRPARQPDEPPRHPINDRDEASVDSELAVLGMGQDADGAVGNPYFRSFTAAVDAAIPPSMLLVCRLDALDEVTVRSIIDDSMATEKRGLRGWGYIDLRGLKSGPHKQGDEWLAACVEAMRKQGIPVAADRIEATLPDGFPMREAAVYYGWYSEKAVGPFTEAETIFTRGGIGVHIHSFSASSLRNPETGWILPLQARGASVTAGNVYEPYLGMTLHPDLFQDRLMAGFCVADAAYMSMPALSWMTIVCADPLYRPYAAWARIVPGAGTGDEWMQFRKVVIDNAGLRSAAEGPLISLADSLRNPMPLEALGCWQLDARDFRRALESFRAAKNLAGSDWQKFRCDWWSVRTLVAMGKKEDAAALAREVIRGNLPPAQQSLMMRELLALDPPPPP